MHDLLTAIALAIALEGMVYALFPDTMKGIISRMLDAPSPALRTAGLMAAVFGVALVAILRGTAILP